MEHHHYGCFYEFHSLSLSISLYLSACFVQNLGMNHQGILGTEITNDCLHNAMNAICFPEQFLYSDVYISPARSLYGRPNCMFLWRFWPAYWPDKYIECTVLWVNMCLCVCIGMSFAHHMLSKHFVFDKSWPTARFYQQRLSPADIRNYCHIISQSTLPSSTWRQSADVPQFHFSVQYRTCAQSNYSK